MTEAKNITRQATNSRQPSDEPRNNTKINRRQIMSPTAAGTARQTLSPDDQASEVTENVGRDLYLSPVAIVVESRNKNSM